MRSLRLVFGAFFIKEKGLALAAIERYDGFNYDMIPICLAYVEIASFPASRQAGSQ
ncbi:MAG: hypothetical protein JWR50_2930 [Mucilaginibacter sp.]|nr:hypothetical protein [Mucilaginibacter sp.]